MGYERPSSLGVPALRCINSSQRARKSHPLRSLKRVWPSAPPPPQKQSEELQSDKSRYSGPALQRFELDSEPGAASCLNVCSWRRWLLLGVKGLREGSTVPVGFGPRDLEGKHKGLGFDLGQCHSLQGQLSHLDQNFSCWASLDKPQT